MTVRPAREADARAIAEIHNPIIRDTAHTFTTEARQPTDIATSIAAGVPHWVVDIDGRVEGFARLAPFRSGPGYVYTLEHSLYLAPDARGRGLGTDLMRAVEDGAAVQGARSLIGCIGGENAGGVGFHTAVGFCEVGRILQAGWKFGRWHDLILMQKVLSGRGSAE